MGNEFKDAISKLTDVELIRIVTTERESYQPIAVEAAEEEINLRNIDSTKFNRVKTQATIKKERTEIIESNLGSKTSRFINFIVDTSIIFLLIFGVRFLLEDISENVFRLSLRLTFLFFLGYYAFFETVFQKTIGKFITKTKVVLKDGEKPNGKQIYIRTLCRLIPFDLISFLFERKGFKFHDSFSKTKVIHSKKL